MLVHLRIFWLGKTLTSRGSKIATISSNFKPLSLNPHITKRTYFTRKIYGTKTSHPGLTNVRLYSTTIDIDEAKKALETAIDSYKPSVKSDWKDFQQVANGVFQSEGSVTARIRGDKLTVSPVVVLGQNFSSEAVEFFVRFYYEIGQIGKLSVVKTKTLSGKLHIRWTTESWKAILGDVTNYFSFVYGEKFIVGAAVGCPA